MIGPKEFNSAVRAHYNFVEGVNAVTVFELIAGLAHPMAAATLGGLYIVGRVFYSYGYATSEFGMFYLSSSCMQ